MSTILLSVDQPAFGYAGNPTTPNQPHAKTSLTPCEILKGTLQKSFSFVIASTASEIWLHLVFGHIHSSKNNKTVRQTPRSLTIE